ncbi:alpha-L-glutamate ligase-like protein [Nitrincola sp. MINF-07-Sa-05]|uniref:alpha-L-glutamate ligase-like protein n=1 Tax=Nitrincola salilacus TaxID=3400273 RepID=UPI0039186334
MLGAIKLLTQRWQALRAAGVLGMNERNISYIGAYNDRSLFPLVDDKLKTKVLAQKYRISTPQLLGVIRTQGDIAQLESQIRGAEGFVIKPSKGSGGKGILVILKQEDGRFQKSSGDWVERLYVERHLSNLLSGLYSLGGNPDVALIEGLIRFDPSYSHYTFEGVPDIRVIVYRGYPIMAMMRLSTRSSNGKANLHQGAIGVGISIADGQAVKAIQHDRPVTHHPDTGQLLSELKISGWTQLLGLAARSYEMTGLGYLGVDLVLDQFKGPQLLELNARPGLAIQMANGTGLSLRTQVIDQHLLRLDHETETSVERAASAQRLFTTTPLFESFSDLDEVVQQ